MTEDATQALALQEQPEIKLFGKWSSSDIEVSDISLQVCGHIFVINDYLLSTYYFLFINLIGLHCC